MSLAASTELPALDKAVRRALEAHEAWLLALRGERVDEAFAAAPPLERHREVAGRRAYQELEPRQGASDGWLEAVRRWVAALTLARVTGPQQAELARIVTEPCVRLRSLGEEQTSFRGAWKNVLDAPTLARADEWVEALGRRGPAVADARRQLAERGHEAARQLGFESPEALLSAVPRASLDEAAEGFLSVTRDIARAVVREGSPDRRATGSFVEVVSLATARDAVEGWPARLLVRTLLETLGPSAAATFPVRACPPMPDSVPGAATFARVLAALGAAYRRGLAGAGGVPFALAVDPYFVDVDRYGFVFGALPALVVYQRRGLGVSARVAAAQARSLARTGLLHARSVAAAYLLSGPPRGPEPGRFAELMHEVFGDGVPRGLCGAFPSHTGHEARRLHALLTTASLLRGLRDAFDDDWFRNPRAWEHLRARASGVARATDEPLAPAELAGAFEAALA
jgi:hypothetical protein